MRQTIKPTTNEKYNQSKTYKQRKALTKYEENKTICFLNYYADTYNHRPRAMGINYLHRAGRWLDW